MDLYLHDTEITEVYTRCVVGVVFIETPTATVNAPTLVGNVRCGE